jgi:hypothetical protein
VLNSYDLSSTTFCPQKVVLIYTLILAKIDKIKKALFNKKALKKSAEDC